MTQPENYQEENLHNLSIEDILSWPNTPDQERYEATAVNAEIIPHLSYEQAKLSTTQEMLTDAYHYNSLLREQEAAIEADNRLSDALAFLGDQDLTKAVLTATAHMNSDATIGLTIILPVDDPTITDQINSREPAYTSPPDIILATSDFVFGTLPRHPGWMGFCPALRLITGCEALVFEDNETQRRPATVIAYPKADIQDDNSPARPFPPGQATTVRNLLLWHGASPRWMPSKSHPSQKDRHKATGPTPGPGVEEEPSPPTLDNPHLSAFCSPQPVLHDYYETHEIATMMTWPNTPGLDRYTWGQQEFGELVQRDDFGDEIINPLESKIPIDEFCDGRHYQTIVMLCGDTPDAEERLRGLLTSPSHLNICQLALNAIKVVDTSETTGLCILIPAAATHANTNNIKREHIIVPPLAIPESLISEPVDISISELSKDPAWAGLDPALPSLKGLNALVVGDPQTPQRPAAVIALPPTATKDPGPLATPFPEGHAATLRDLLAWHGATPFWISPRNLADLQ